jgi:hypothetical protein
MYSEITSDAVKHSWNFCLWYWSTFSSKRGLYQMQQVPSIQFHSPKGTLVNLDLPICRRSMHWSYYIVELVLASYWGSMVSRVKGRRVWSLPLSIDTNTRADQPITDHLPMTEQFGRSFSILLHFWVIKNVIGAQALQIILKMQSQRTSRAVKKIHFFKLQNVFFFHFTSS